MLKREPYNAIKSALRFGVIIALCALSCFAQGKNPLILIPGLSGSELRHSETKERVWFKTFKSKSEDLRLPLQADSTKMHDKLIATDVLREVKLGIFPGVDIYGGFIKAMQLRGGYTEEKFDAPSADGYQDSLYVFAYDWRLDNVENARLLIKKLEALRKHFNKPNLKFDIVAHSMGGIISRYAAMYGDSDVLDGKDEFHPTWAGSRYFDKIIMIGTPHEGAANALNSLINGFALGGMRIDLPFVQDTSKYLVFSVPASFQLLPAPGSLRVFDDKLEPLEIDLYDTKTWKKYGWDVTNDKGFPDEFNLAERKVADQYFANVLARSKRLHEALAAANGKSTGVDFFTVGCDCKKDTPDGVVIYRDAKADKWKTLFRAKGFTRSDGYKFTDDDLKKVIHSPGDGIVPIRSLEAKTQSVRVGVASIYDVQETKLICQDHNRQFANSMIQDYVIKVLARQTAVPKPVATNKN
jgi:pimeloyl-ACP methyl ester carboxylesterase